MYTNIINPKTGEAHQLSSKMGKQVVLNYLQQLIGGEVSHDEQESPYKEIGNYLIEYCQMDSVRVQEVLRDITKLLEECVNKVHYDSCLDLMTLWNSISEKHSMKDLKVFYYWCKLVVDAIVNNPTAESVKTFLRGLKFPEEKVSEFLRSLSEFIDWTSGLPEPPLTESEMRWSKVQARNTVHGERGDQLRGGAVIGYLAWQGAICLGPAIPLLIAEITGATLVSAFVFVSF